MYKQVAKMTPVARLYENQLLEQGVITQDEVREFKALINQKHEEGYMRSKNHKYKAEDWVTEEWAKLKQVDEDK
jgi:2-oxoglutarate dehydrogenase complex dehydrogenase (E1) component-like enzyme